MGCDMTDDDPSAGPVGVPGPSYDWVASKARHPSTPDPLAQLDLFQPTEMPMFTVQCDALALLDHFDNDQENTFDFLSKLKDLLNG